MYLGDVSNAFFPGIYHGAAEVALYGSRLGCTRLLHMRQLAEG